MFDPARVEEARRLCYQCPVADLCLVEALERREPDGVWGGLTTDERQRLVSDYEKSAAS